MDNTTIDTNSRDSWTEGDAARLLASMAGMVNQEILNVAEAIVVGSQERDSIVPSDADQGHHSTDSLEEIIGAVERIRTVSLDFGEHQLIHNDWKNKDQEKEVAVAISDISSPASPVLRSRHITTISSHTTMKPLALPNTTTASSSKKKITRSIAAGGTKTILRRKFTWKNYPELEAFLIANREEYLRHSALNYTIQQKKYNNELTERLLELATKHGYVFDERDFSFVAVRDRIRCYYKSYVQSSKKRGIIIGYAARRAGLMSKAEIERSVKEAGHIVVPM